ncbi:TetR/AcrR family transcriptional regulator [Nonomuraea sp. M3C6]|uniref:TetR/AcrR family transcriptional regulator n=1 Tax=Nonomuraea marmarensis TaxID=3351344 RepID=A0ABW7AUE3_9ACTN
MKDTSGVPPDRRQRRRAETIAEILAIAEEQMAADGVAALNLAQVARRMGLTPAALYQYFAAKNAIYEALFALGMAELEPVLVAAEKRAQTDPVAAMTTCQQDILRWCMNRPVLAQIIFLRPVPGFEPSEQTWAFALSQFQRLREILRMAGAAGQVRPEGATDDAMEILVCLASGVLTRQLANEPDAPVDGGRIARLLPTVLDMFFTYYAPRDT